MVQTKQILTSKKNQSYLISSTSREKEDYQRRLFFYRQREVSSFPESDHFGHIYTQIRLETDDTI